MPALPPKTRQRLVLAAAAIAATVGVAALASRDYSDRATAVLQDAGLSRHTGAERTTDLLTAPVKPGATVETGVNLPRGARASSIDGPGTFEVVSHTHTDNDDATWLAVTVRNKTGAPMRFVGFVTFSMPGGD